MLRQFVMKIYIANSQSNSYMLNFSLLNLCSLSLLCLFIGIVVSLLFLYVSTQVMESAMTRMQQDMEKIEQDCAEAKATQKQLEKDIRKSKR